MNKCVTKTLANCRVLSPSGNGCGECLPNFILTIATDMSSWKCVPTTGLTIPNGLKNCWYHYDFVDGSGAPTHCMGC